MAGASGQSYTISGIKVQFPHKAYPSQISMMDKIIKGLDKSQNCLLESPTGSGKSLALLCSALAWQKHEIEKIKQEEKDGYEKGTSCTCGKVEKSDTGEASPYFESTNEISAPGISNGMVTGDGVPPAVNQNLAANQITPLRAPVLKKGTDSSPIELDLEDDDDDFKMETKRFRTPGQSGKPPVEIMYEEEGKTTTPSTPAPAWTMEVTKKPEEAATCGGSGGDNGGGCCSCECGEFKPRRKIPKIFFGTRTHKQIAQIARELGKTAYSGTKMTILSSREHSCIHPGVSQMSSKNEECKNLRDGPGCRFFDNVKRKISHAALRLGGLHEAWDLEDFKGLCRKEKACAYYGGRDLKRDADIIFCPYNYLIDPNIRESELLEIQRNRACCFNPGRLEIYLNEQIVILDEAHNIEDSSRDAASYTMPQQSVTETIDDLNKMIGESKKVVEHRAVRDMMTGFHDLIESNRESIHGDNYDTGYKLWTGMEMIAQLKMCGLTEENAEYITSCYKEISVDDSEQDEDKNEVVLKLKSGTTQCLGSLFTMLKFIFKNNMQFIDDYRLALVKTMAYVNNQPTPNKNGWLRKKRGQRTLQFTFSINFWCMNPAVSFTDLGTDSRCVILTSGTLSPMNSFQSELGVPFPIQLEANHVIDKSQVWVGTISKGPLGAQLLGTYQHSETFAYQDDVGETLLEVCRTVPHGVLCFVSSYKTIEKFFTRWKSTGLYERLEQHKVVMSEPKASERVDFDELIKQYYETIEEYEDSDLAAEGVTGALFVAVCRGKVSEGLDFADNNARAVITIGIPFPHVKDPQVDLKKQYNNMHSMKRGLLRGGEWYEIQAYRALNQALGRCIRHKNDWGALILIDERFAKCPQRYTKGLSKWVRQKVQYFHAFPAAKTSLARFTQVMMSTTLGQDTSVMNSSAVVQSPSCSSSISTPDVGRKNIAAIFKIPIGCHSSTVTPKTPSTPFNVIHPQSTQNIVAGTASPIFSRKTTPAFYDDNAAVNSEYRSIPLNHFGQNQQTNVYQLQKSIPVSILKPVNATITSKQFNTNINQHIHIASQQAFATQNEFGSKTIVSEPVDDMEGFIEINDDDLDFNPKFSSTQRHSTGGCFASSQRQSKGSKMFKNRGDVFVVNKNESPVVVNKPQEMVVIEPKGKLKFDCENVIKAESALANRGKLTENVSKSKSESIKDKLNQYLYDGSKDTAQKNETKKRDSLFEFVSIPESSAAVLKPVGDCQAPQIKNDEQGLSRNSSPDMFDSFTEEDQQDENIVMSCDKELDAVIQDICTDINNSKKDDVAKLSGCIVGNNNNKQKGVGSGDGPAVDKLVIVKPLFKSEHKTGSNNSRISSHSDTVSNVKVLDREHVGTGVKSENAVCENSGSVTNQRKDRLRRSRSCEGQNDAELALEADTDTVKEEVKGGESVTGSKVEDEETSVRRSARTKRRAPRRLIGEEVPVSKRLKTKGVDFVDEVEAESLQEYSVKCAVCHKAMIHRIRGLPEPASTLPTLVQKVAKDREVQLIRADRVLQPVPKGSGMELRLQDGGCINSYWSEPDGCCYKYVFCRASSTTLGMEVKCLADNHHSSLQVGQIWLLKDVCEITEVDSAV